MAAHGQLLIEVEGGGGIVWGGVTEERGSDWGEGGKRGGRQRPETKRGGSGASMRFITLLAAPSP